jgi:hypothetical protein
MHPYVSQTLANEHFIDARRQASTARLVAEARQHRTATRRHTSRWGVAERAAWQRLVRSA